MITYTTEFDGESAAIRADWDNPKCTIEHLTEDGWFHLQWTVGDFAGSPQDCMRDLLQDYVMATEEDPAEYFREIDAAVAEMQRNPPADSDGAEPDPVTMCPNCGGPRTGLEQDAFCSACKETLGTVSEIAGILELYETSDDRKYYWDKLCGRRWLSVRDRAQRLTGTKDEGTDLLNLIRSVLTTDEDEWNKLLALTVHELIAMLDLTLIVMLEKSTPGKRRYGPSGSYEGTPCTCQDNCPPSCKGECGCLACSMAYSDFLSGE